MKINYEKIFLKDKYNKFNNIFNIWAFIFGYFYILYRKLYLIGIFIFFLDLLLYVFEYYYCIILINIILGFIFNKLYLKFVRFKISNYKLKYMDSRLVRLECLRNNTNMDIVIIFIAISVVSLIILNIDFNSYMVNIQDLSLKLDKNWNESNYNNEYYSVYNYNNSCSITIEAISYSNQDEYMNNIINSYNSNGNIIDININNINYKFVNINNNYIYSTYIKDKLYVILFDIYDDDNLCYDYKDNIMNTVKIKN